MLNRRAADFHTLVWQAASRVGNSAPKIADAILRNAFPRTSAEAEIEGADRMLRVGVISEIKSILRSSEAPDGQTDFADIDPQFVHIASELKSRTYYVEGAGEYISIPELIADPELLNDARRFMRRKGEECIAEADRLDQLYAAVTA